MEKEKKTYSRRDYLNNYKLTEEEYYLLPLIARMEYCYQNAGGLLNNIREIGQKVIIDEEIPNYLLEFFEHNGCEVTHEGDERDTEITLISNDSYALDSSVVKARLDDHLYRIIKAKITIFENKKLLREQIDQVDEFGKVDLDFELVSFLKSILSSPISELDLDDHDMEFLLESELEMLIEEVENNENNIVTIKRPNDLYIDYLNQKGYEVSDDGENITIRKPLTVKTEEPKSLYKSHFDKQHE